MFFFDHEMGSIAFFLCVIGFIAFVAFLSSLDRVLKRIDYDNRRMDPSLVWLNLIPVFNLVWMVVTVERVGESIRNEFLSRGRHKKAESYGKTSGLAFIILSGPVIAFSAGTSPCMLAFLPFAFIYWIVYWLQISNYARRLKQEPAEFTPSADEGW